MMGVYINMEMPENCALCPMWDAGNCLTASEAIICEYDKLPQDCPIVHVPPHGRLIDKDVMCNECRRIAEEYDGIYPDCTYCPAHLAPTIIPAEPAEEGEW